MSSEVNYSLLGKQYFEAGQYSKSIEIFESCLKQGERLGWIYNLLGHSYLHSNEPAKALLVFNNFKELYPKNPAAFAGIVKVHLATEDFDNCLTLLK